MSIIGKIRGLFFGERTEPVEQVPARAVPQKVEAQSGKAGANEPDSVTVGELQNAPLPSCMADICSGYRFCATMQLRTPLRVLLRHGELYLKNDGRQPQIACEQWEGIWVWKTKTWKELGIDLPERQPGMMASSIGPIPTDGGDYLPFLIAVRKIVETHDSIEHRIKKLREMPIEPNWLAFVSKHGGIEGIAQYFFPRYITPMPNFSAGTVCELSRLGLDSPSHIAAATDDTLLSIKGIGPAKLKAIRAHLADMAKDRDADRIENVIR